MSVRRTRKQKERIQAQRGQQYSLTDLPFDVKNSEISMKKEPSVVGYRSYLWQDLRRTAIALLVVIFIALLLFKVRP